VKVGVIGCGRWGKNHARTLSALGVLAAVADERPEARAAFAEEFGCAQMTPQAMIDDPAIGAVVVVLPPDSQAGMALAVLAAGKHAMIEKPMAMTVADAEAIASAARSAGVTAMTGHLLLFHPAHLAIRELVRTGALGDLRLIRTERAGWGSFFPGTDVAWDLLPHDLSMILDILGDLPQDGQMQARAVVSPQADIASLRMSVDALAIECFVSRVAPSRGRSMLVQGTRASALWNDLEADWSRKLVVVEHSLPSPSNPRPIALAETMALDSELRHFLSCIQSGARPRGHVEDAARIIACIARTPVV
jgi:predicted dehydrogenase